MCSACHAGCPFYFDDMLLCAQVYSRQQTETSNKPGKCSVLQEVTANLGTHSRAVHFPRLQVSWDETMASYK